jgi:acetyltransferase-like isoleucine patch superfamily enzyme
MKAFILRMTQSVELVLFFLLNKHSFKKLELKALIDNPRRIDGAEYISIHKSVRIKQHCWLTAMKIDGVDPDLTFGEGCSIGDFNHIAAVRSVVFGKNVLTANGVYISDNLHCYEDINTPIMFQPIRFKSPVVIGEGSWIGENACIIGAKIGKNCVIGANSVVSRDIPDYSVAVGAPARVIRRLDTKTNRWLAVA